MRSFKLTFFIGILVVLLFAVISFSQTASEWANMASDYVRESNWEKAIECYTKAIEITPNDKHLYSARGQYYENSYKFDLALKDRSKLIELDPTDAWAYIKRGLTYRILHEDDAAKNDFKKACDLGNYIACEYLEDYKPESDNSKNYKKKIRNAIEAKDYSKVIVICDEATEYFADDADFYYYKGLALTALDQFDEAKKAYDKAISIHVDKRIGIDHRNVEALKHFMKGHKNSKENIDVAIEEYLMSQNLEPENEAGFYSASVRYLHGKNDPDKAIEYAFKALGVRPDSHISLHVLGLAFQKKEEWEKAFFYYNLVLLMNPDYIIKDDLLTDINECKKHLND